MLHATFQFGDAPRHTMEVRVSWWGGEEYSLDGKVIGRRWSPLSNGGTREFVVERNVVRIEFHFGLKKNYAKAFVDGQLHVEDLFPQLSARYEKRQDSKRSSPLISGMLWSAITTVLASSTPLASGKFMSFTIVAIVAAIFAILPILRGQKRVGIAGTIVCIPALLFALHTYPDMKVEAAKYQKRGAGNLPTTPQPTSSPSERRE